MRFSLSWLKQHLDIQASLETLIDSLTRAGIEVQYTYTSGIQSDHIIIAEVLSYIPHPNADRLRLCQVNTGRETRQIVCGASNFKPGDRVPLALPGAILPGNFKIKETKIRGELSQGMMCSAKELNIAEDSEGLLILDPQAPLGVPLHHYLQPDTFLDIEITPNRPDLCSYIGLAREIAALGLGTLTPSPSPIIHLDNTAPPFPVHNTAPEACPYYTAILLDNIRIAPSPSWLANKIKATGHRPINNVVDITNYILWETGQPLHAFDADLLNGSTLTIRHAQPSEAFAALDDHNYLLTPQDVIIADNQNPQALAGVIGGRLSCVSEHTTRILLEAAFFEPSYVRRSAHRHGIHTDSSYRFERRIDPHALLAARDRAINLIIELCQAKIASAPTILGSPPPPPPPITLRSRRITEIIGTEIPKEKIHSILSSLHLKLQNETPSSSQWLPPTHRHDLTSEIDLIEEIVRLHGMESIPSHIHFHSQPPSTTDLLYRRIQNLRYTLASRGWHETLGEPLLNPKTHALNSALPILNPLNEHYTHLRPSLIPSLLKAAAYNLSHGNTGIRLFEINRITHPDGSESYLLALAITGLNADPHWLEPQRPFDFYDLTSITSLLENNLRIPHTCLTTPPQNLPSATKKLYGIKRDTFIAEYDLTTWLQSPEPPPPTLPPLPKYPSARRDLALLVDPKITHSTITSIIQKNAPPILERFFLFDQFTDPQGEKIPADKKSLAYAFIFRHPERTLHDEEIEQALQKIQTSLSQNTQATIRTI
ncbi:MAG: phenylalanine--tRNA ligase subunit beta [Verrucomicrobiae bacterium]|nr:phenylalanine--tRNA ligase subunit beta [Verrucomicrobiae bacterium]